MKFILTIIFSLFLLASCQPGESDINTTDETSSTLDGALVTTEGGLFLDENYGFYFKVPASWEEYEVIYTPPRRENLGEEIQRGDLAFGAEKRIDFSVNGEFIISIWIADLEKWAAFEEVNDGPLPNELRRGNGKIYMYSVNQGVQTDEAKQALADFVETIDSTFGLS